MAEYRELYDSIRAAGADMLAITVDDPGRSEALRRELRLPFPILCDTQREVVRAWGVYNTKEKGGIAEPSVFIVGGHRRVLFGSLDGEVERVPAAAIVEFLRGGMKLEAGQALRRRARWPSPRDFVRALVNALRFGVRSPQG